MSGTTRITVQALAAQVAEQNAETQRTLDGIVNVLGSLTQVVMGGQFNTPAEVVTSITDAPSVRGVSEQIEVFVKGESKAKVAMPESLREGFATLKATKDAMSPLNKALAQVRKGQPWVKATECSPEDIATALALVTTEQGKDVAKAALDALVVRVEAAEKRASSK